MKFNRCLGCMQPKSEESVCNHCGYDEKTNNSIHQLPLGSVLHGQYLVGRVLGQGGFGITYIGWDLQLDTIVAIKEFFPNGLVARDNTYSSCVTECEGSRQDIFHNSRARFLREAKALAKFSEIPEIVHVRNFFEENNTAYIIMEYVKGMDLRHFVDKKGGKLGVDETLKVMRPLIRAISVVHKADLIHRDISPDNIMLLPDGNIKLLDFGAVRDIEIADPNKDLPKSTEAILKHGFAPMEQYQKHGNLGPWTDVYALCATAFFCMTGSVPPDAPARMMENIHPNWYEIPGIRSEYAQALEKGMAMRAKDRTASVEELYDQLYNCSPTAKTNNTQPKSETKVKQKKPKKFVAVLAAMAVICAVSAGALLFLTANQSEGNTQLQYADNSAASSTATLPPVTTVPNAAEALTTPEEIQTTTVPESQLNPSSGAVEEYTKTWNYADDAWKKNVLGNLAPPETSMDKTTYAVFGLNVPRNQIQSVTFLDNYADAPDTARDVSKDGNGSVLAWLVADGELYDMYIGAAGGINGVSACKKLFQGYCNLKTITFGSYFHTDDAVSLAYMFDGCTSLETVNVSYFDTSKVSDMSYMFANCSSLKEINIENFKTSNVMHMTGMFAGCPASVKINVENFDTGLAVKHENFMDIGGTVNGKPWEELFQ